MDALLVVEKVTNEIIEHFRLPKKVCYPFLKKMLAWVYVAGWEEGRKQYKKRAPVMQLDQWGNLIKIYKSVTDAARRMGCDKSNITKVLKGRKHSASGFLWRKIEKEEEINKILEEWQHKL